MTTETKLETVNEVTKKAMENLTELAELNMKVLDKVTTGQKKALDLFMEQSKRQVELATKAKGFDEFIKGQAELAKETSERMLEETKTSMQVANEMREKYSAMVKDQIAKFTDKVRSFTPGMGS